MYVLEFPYFSGNFQAEIYSCFHVITNSVAPSSPNPYKPYTTHYSSIRSDKGLMLEESSFWIPVRWPIYVTSSIDTTKLSREVELCTICNFLSKVPVFVAPVKEAKRSLLFPYCETNRFSFSFMCSVNVLRLRTALPSGDKRDCRTLGDYRHAL